jgi:hypothetical protein
VLSAFGSNSFSEGFSDNGLVWHTLGSHADAARVYGPLISRIEDYVNPADEDGGRPEIRLALVHGQSQANVDEANQIHADLMLNGRNAVANGDEFYLRSFYDSEDPDAFERVLVELSEFRPHIVVAPADDSFLVMMMALDGNWPTIAPDQPPPFYVLSSYHTGPELLDMVAAAPELRTRIVGVAPAAARDRTLYEAYLAKLKLDNPYDFALDGMENLYDAAYFMMYAASAAVVESEPLVGLDLAHGMRRIVAGPSYDIGPEAIPSAFEWLRTPDNTLSLKGTLGEPRYDVGKGTRLDTEGSVWCIAEEADGSLDYHFDRLTMAASGKELEGASSTAFRDSERPGLSLARCRSRSATAPARAEGRPCSSSCVRAPRFARRAICCRRYARATPPGRHGGIA